MQTNRVPTGTVIKSYMDYYKIPMHRLQDMCEVPPNELEDFLDGKIPINDDLALGICKCIDVLSLEFLYKYDKKYRESLKYYDD